MTIAWLRYVIVALLALVLTSACGSISPAGPSSSAEITVFLVEPREVLIATPAKVRWESNQRECTGLGGPVSWNGKKPGSGEESIIPREAGPATITINCGGKIAEAAYTVTMVPVRPEPPPPPPPPGAEPTGVNLEPADKSVNFNKQVFKVGDSIQLKAVATYPRAPGAPVVPEKDVTDDPRVKWSSSAPPYAEVDSAGLVTVKQVPPDGRVYIILEYLTFKTSRWIMVGN